MNLTVRYFERQYLHGVEHMALTSVANNTAGTLSNAGQQKAAEAVQSKEKLTQPAEAKNSAGKIGDTVTLSQSEKAAAPVESLAENQVGDVLPRAKEAIMQNSKAAVASQANVDAALAQEMLADN